MGKVQRGGGGSISSARRPRAEIQEAREQEASKRFGVQNRITGNIIRRCSTLKLAQQLAQTCGDLCGNPTAFRAVRVK